MRDSPPDPERRGRVLRRAAVVGIGSLTLGSCGGLLLGHYTVTGMNPLYDSPEPAYASLATHAPAGESVAWVDAGAEVREARRAADESAELMPAAWSR